MDRPSTPLETILIASWLEPALVERIRTVATDMDVIYEPDLLRPPRYPADHKGTAVERSEEQEALWRDLLRRATIMFDFDMTHLEDLPELAPKIRWIQATSAGIGQLVKRLGYGARMPDTVLTTASGVHARPLAEFAVMSMLAHTRRLLDMRQAQNVQWWERFAGTDLDGRTVLIVGYGAIGREVGRLAQAFGMTVLGVRGRPDGSDPASLHAHEIHGPGALPDLLPRAEYLVLSAPHTDETDALIGPDQLAALPAGAVVVNIGRGALIDEPALVAALESGHLGGAYLDVFATEPLPGDSPLWGMHNVLVSPHSASTSDRENARIVELFCQNIELWRAGAPLRNALDTERLY